MKPTDHITEDQPTPQERLDLKRAFDLRHAPEPDVDAAWQRQMARDFGQKPGRPASRRWMLWVAAAAAVVLLIVVLWPDGSTPTREGQVFTANDEAPEVRMEYRGEEKSLTSPAVAFHPVASSAEPENITVTTSRGKTLQLSLPDGTKVWLNADSKLVFPERFVGQQRRVEFSGEAYFEVSHDARHPFVVSTPYLQTTVLGTSFNLRAYSGSDASVVLVEGKVAVSNGSDPVLTLEPNQQASLTADGKLSAHSVDPYPLTQWKEGFFYFNESSLRSIMQELGRWYNVNVVFESSSLMNVRLHFVAERTLRVNEIVRRLNALKVARFSLEDNAIVIK